MFGVNQPSVQVIYEGKYAFSSNGKFVLQLCLTASKLFLQKNTCKFTKN